MQPTIIAEEGEPEATTSLFSKSLFFILATFFLTGCNQSKKEAVIAPVIDRSAIVEQIKTITAAVLKKVTPKKKIYITFDDGPNRGTLNVLQVVKEENIPVSFFIVGKHVFDSPQQTATWEQLKEDTAIALCNHSYTHAGNRYTKFYEDPEGVVNDFEKSQEQLQFTNNVARMPGRNAWRIDSINVTDINQSRAAIDSVHKAGFAVMGWDIEWSFDHKTMAPDTATSILLRRIQNLLDAETTKTPGHLVLLAHDQAFQKVEDVQKLHAFLQELKNNTGYEFVLASEYPGVKKKLAD
ncbi:MAG: polysaccharide deacetylase family protein [Chitinophagaceae bacterium]